MSTQTHITQNQWRQMVDEVLAAQPESAWAKSFDGLFAARTNWKKTVEKAMKECSKREKKPRKYGHVRPTSWGKTTYDQVRAMPAPQGKDGADYVRQSLYDMWTESNATVGGVRYAVARHIDCLRALSFANVLGNKWWTPFHATHDKLNAYLKASSASVPAQQP